MYLLGLTLLLHAGIVPLVAGLSTAASTPAPVQEPAYSESDLAWNEPEPEFTAETVWRVDQALERKPRRVESVDEETLERAQVTTLADALQWISGASTTQSAGSALAMTIDGLDASNITIMENGVAISRHTNSNLGPVIDPSRFPIDPSRVQRVEVHRGVGPAGSGANAGIIINVITEQGVDDTEVHASVAGGAASGSSDVDGLFFRNDAQAGATLRAGDHTSISANGGYLRRQAWDGNADGIFDLPEQEGWNAGLRAEWTPERRNSLQLDLRRNDNQVDTLGNPLSPVYDRTRTREWRFALSGQHRPGDARVTHDTAVLLFNHRFDKIVRESGFERNNTDTNAVSLRNTTQTTHYVGDHDLSPELGVDVELVDRTGASGSIEPVRRSLVGAGLGHTWYASSRFEMNDRAWTGVNESGDAFWLAGTDAMFSLSDVVAFRAGASRTFRRQTVEELYLNFDHSEVGYRVNGNESLRPENMRSIRGGLLVNDPRDRGGFEFEAFSHWQSDMITTAPVDTPDASPVATFTYVNIARARNVGMNSTLRWNDLPWKLQTRLSYSWLPISIDAETGDDLVFRSEHSGRAELRRAFFSRRLELWVASSLRSAMVVPADQPGAPGYATVDAGLVADAGRGFSIIAAGTNLADQTNSLWGPRPGRLVQLTLSYQQRFERD